MSAGDDRGNDGPTLSIVPPAQDEPTFLRPGDLPPEGDHVRAIQRDVSEIKIKLDSVLDFLRRDREERIEDRARLNQLERDIIDHRKQLAAPRRKAKK